MLFESAPASFEQVMSNASASEPQAFPLPVRMRVDTRSARRTVTSANVLGSIRGSDPILSNEYVVYTAHLDHLGVGPEIGGDSIYNGAVDNASGVAALIEVARAFESLKQRPRRSVLFIATTGEDAGYVGLLGSDYFARNPTVPRSRLIADINIDGMPIFSPFRDVVAYGAEHSSLSGPVHQAASKLGLEVLPDPWSDQGMFSRSDQYSFVRQGIPSIWISMGFKAADPHVDAMRLKKDYLAKRYHQPSDDMKQPIHFEVAASGARVEFLTGAIIANGGNRPVWNAGDFFGELFGAVRQQ